MTSTTEQSGFLPRIRLGEADITAWVVALGLIAVSLVVLAVTGKEQVFPEALTSRFPFTDWVNQAEEWLRVHFRWFTRAIAEGIKWALSGLEERLILLPWLAVLVAFTMPALAYGGLRLAIPTALGVMMWGAFGLWFEAMSTLALMGVAVALCIVMGTTIGILCARSDRIEAFVKPILDTMQVMPAFVYLMPTILFFGIGAHSGCLAVMIYALPPMIRLTNLGIRQVPHTMIEAAESFGTTRRQLLFKVQIPQALPSIMLGINQTIMMALALAVLAIFVGSGGLGDPVWNAIRRLRVGASLEAGLCIVAMAIIFDRLSRAMSEPPIAPKLAPGEPLFRLLPQGWAFNPLAQAIERGVDLVWRLGSVPSRGLTALFALVSVPARDWAARHPYLIIGVLLFIAILIVDGLAPRSWKFADYPRGWEVSIRQPVDDAIAWLTANPAFIAVTKAIRTGVYLNFLKPFDTFLTHLPWWYVTGLATWGVWAAAGWRLGLLTLLSLLFCGASGLWDLTMYTFAGTMVSVLFCLIIGVPFGIWAAYSKTAESILRPMLDLMQTIPSFVYLIPALFFFGGNPTTAIIATVIYAIPPIIRTTTLGLRQIPAEIDEVSRAFGARTLQSLIRVKIPLASPSIMLGVNQTVIMALAMQTVTPLVAGLGLGKEVYDAMNIANTGKGLTAGIGIVLMAVILDRLSQAMTATQRKALGLT